MNKPHKHAELIKAWADGAEIECQTERGMWEPVADPGWYEEVEYRIKKSIVKTVGYRRYLSQRAETLRPCYCYEDAVTFTTQFYEGCVDFVKWLDYEWKYDEVEL